MSGTHQYALLCSVILKETFGETAEHIGMILFRHGPRTLGQIVKLSGLPLGKVQQTLLGLCNYSLIKISKLSESSPLLLYSIKSHQIVFVQRYVRSLPVLTARFGCEGEILLDTLMKNGCEPASTLLLHAATRLVKSQEGSPPTYEEALLLLWERFGQMLDQEFVCRAIGPPPTRRALPQKIPLAERFKLPMLNLGELRTRLESEQAPWEAAKEDKEILWRINQTRVTQLLRDEMIASAITSRVDEHAGELVRILLTFLDRSPVQIVHINEIRAQVKKSCPGSHLENFLRDYLQILVDDSSKILRLPDYGVSGQFQITLKPALEELSWAAAEKVVHEQFGSRGSHIFRVIRMRRQVDQDQIQEAAMIPAREAKQMTYRLMDASLINVREMRLPSASATSAAGDLASRRPGGASSYLFHINFMQLARNLLEACHVAQHAAIVRRFEVSTRFDYLFSKQQQLAAFSMSLEVTPEQIDDIMTASERRELSRVVIWKERLNYAEYDVDESTLLFDLYIRCCKGVIDPPK